ncbi:hypothetical protein BS50DRAFT_451345, partial [Corynespora cassiicola Philippines]
WPFHFHPSNALGADAANELTRRYAIIAQVSACVPIIPLATWSYRRAIVRLIKTAPINGLGPSTALRRASTRMTWWLENPLSAWLGGTRFQWLVGLYWAAWLSFLCTHNTNSDYLHLTKRIGAMAVSQLPLTLLLSLKSRYSPAQIILRIDERHLNIYHRTLARIVFVLALCHVALYLNFYVVSGRLLKRIRDSDVRLGLSVAFVFGFIAVTSTQIIREWNYRVFFVSHVSAALASLVLILFHAEHARLFTIQSIILYLVNLVARMADTRTFVATLAIAPSDDIVVTLRPSKQDGNSSAPLLLDASHVYVGVQAKSTFRLFAAFEGYAQRNPFTVFGMDMVGQHTRLFIRPQRGQTAVLRAMAESQREGNRDMHELLVEGPYGRAAQFASPSAFANRVRERYHNILLVSAGSGASFIMPLFSSILAGIEAAHPDTPSCRIQLILVMKTQVELETVLNVFESTCADADIIKMFVTRPTSQRRREGLDVELQIATSHAQVGEELVRSGRPDWEQIVDDWLDHEIPGSLPSAIFCCGPAGLRRSVRDACGAWVRKGADVDWYEEGF